jgi:ParB-like chromosome segregation protein Spo0J
VKRGTSVARVKAPVAPPAATARIEWLDPRVIQWPEKRITSEYDAERAEALRRSMAELGQQDAVGVVELENGIYEGAAGMNRCLAAIQSGAETVMCVVRPGTHLDVVKSNIATSVNQSRANPLSEVEGIANAHEGEGISIEELVALTGKSEAWVEDRLAIAQASPVVKQCLGEGRIGIGHAAVLASIDDLARQEELLGLQLMHGWTVRELEEQVNGGGPSEPRKDGAEGGQGGGRARHPLICSYCSRECAAAEAQRTVVCANCSDKLTQPLPVDGAILVPVELLKEAASILAGSQAGASIAERLAVLVEG